MKASLSSDILSDLMEGLAALPFLGVDTPAPLPPLPFPLPPPLLPFDPWEPAVEMEPVELEAGLTRRSSFLTGVLEEKHTDGPPDLYLCILVIAMKYQQCIKNIPTRSWKYLMHVSKIPFADMMLWVSIK